jgi:hypothetical protein
MSLLTQFATFTNRLVPRRVSAVTYGVIAGLLAVGVQVFFGVKPPPAYGICVACHTRDVIDWLANHLIGTRWEIAPVSLVLPLLTTIGMLIGAYAAARRNNERRRVGLGGHWRSFIYGVLVMNAAIVALGCPTRLLLLSAFGDFLAVLAVGGVVAGILTGTFLLARGIVS